MMRYNIRTDAQFGLYATVENCTTGNVRLTWSPDSGLEGRVEVCIKLVIAGASV